MILFYRLAGFVAVIALSFYAVFNLAVYILLPVTLTLPGIAGIMGQLYQAYKELNGGVNPNSALMKGVLLNSADDLGNPGPDFKHGWGEVNAYQAIKILENNQYLNSNISQGGNNTHNITVPSAIIQLNVMVYWHDIEGSVNAAPAVVNDIDIKKSKKTNFV